MYANIKKDLTVQGHFKRIINKIGIEPILKKNHLIVLVASDLELFLLGL